MLQIKCDVCGKTYEPILSPDHNLGERLCVFFGTSTAANVDVPHRKFHKEVDLRPRCAKMLFRLCGIDQSKLRLTFWQEQFLRSADEKEEESNE